MALSFLTIAFAGVLLLPQVSGPAWLRLVGRVVAGGLALALSGVTISLYQLGAERHWTGDGPGMLVVMMGVPVAGLCALAAWLAALWPGMRRYGVPGVPPWVAIGMIVVGLVGSAKGARDYRQELRPAHDAPVVALQLADAGTRLVSCDAAGTVMRWNVPERALIDVHRHGSLADADAILITSDGRFAVALGASGARIVPLEGVESAAMTLPGVVHVALLPNGEAAFADASGVRITSLAAPGVAHSTRAFPAGVSSLAADGQGQLFVGLADGSVVVPGVHGEPDRVVARLAAAPRRLVASPGGSWLIALDAERHPAFISARSGEIHREDAWLRMHALAFVNEDRLVFTTSELDPSALAYSLGRFETEPFFNHGQTITALAAAPGVRDAAIALGGDLQLVPAPAPGLHAYADSSVRLVQRGYF